TSWGSGIVYLCTAGISVGEVKPLRVGRHGFTSTAASLKPSRCGDFGNKDSNLLLKKLRACAAACFGSLLGGKPTPIKNARAEVFSQASSSAVIWVRCEYSLALAIPCPSCA